jgi:uncharacterized cupin superfamily protein
MATGPDLLDPHWDAEIEALEGGVLRAVRLGAQAGARRLAANLYELEPGATVSPLHFHHANEELLFVLTGEPTLRRGEGDERALRPGSVVAFPAGPAGVHQVLNRSDGPSRVLIVATADSPEVAEQPETGRLAILTSEGLRIVPKVDLVEAP